MADAEVVPVITDKPRKRKKEGNNKERAKKQRLASHFTGPNCQCSRLKCFEVVDEENRGRLIDAFNAFPSKDAQDSYLASLITVTEISRHRPRLDEPKSSNSNSYHYKVFTKSNSDQNPDGFVYVCFQAFLSIFGIKKGRLETIKKSLATTGEPPVDGRGKHTSRPSKISDELRQRVRNHISSFRGRLSHYSQEKSRRLYLPEELNVNRMFVLFKEKHPDDSLSYESYRTIFNTEFNISFGYPRSDTCSACDQIKAQIEVRTKTSKEQPSEAVQKELEQLKTKRDVHQRKAETFYRRKKDAKQRAKTSPHLEAFTFDYQKNLNLPHQSTSDFYYHRKLSFQSFNIHQLSTDDVFIYCYDETVAKKGSDEVASFLYHHIINQVKDEVTHLEFFCDSCAGQNKNYTILRFMDFMVHHKKRFKSVKVTFPERGHSYMECDRDMGLINTKTGVSISSDWIQRFKAARNQPAPYNVIEVQQNIVRNFTKFLKPLYKKSCPTPTRPLREILFTADNDPGVFSHRDSWNGVFLRTSLCPPGRKVFKACEGEPEQMHRAPIPISLAKYKDLQLLKKFSTNEAFYDALPYDNNVNEPLHEILDN